MKILVVIAIALVAAACGGGGGGSGSSNPPNNGGGGGTNPPPTLTGFFVDARVEGLSYSTATQSGVTNNRGEFAYLSGETIVFSFGSVEIGRAAAQGILTPLDLFSGDPQNQVRLMSFLQSLDEDSDSSNGIALTSFSAGQFQDFINENPGINTFEDVFSHPDYDTLVSRLTNRAQWLSESAALVAFNNEIEPLIQSGQYTRPNGNEIGACPAAPVLDLANIQGGPFSDCGPLTSSRIPDPTSTRHGFGGATPGDPTGMNNQTVCVVPGWDDGVGFAFPDLPDVPIHARDQIYYNTSTTFGVITFTGQRVRWTDVNGGRSAGFVCGPGAENVEYNGNCVCP